MDTQLIIAILAELKELWLISKQENLLALSSLSYSEYAEAFGVTKNHIAARIRYLIKYGYIKRDEEGRLVVLKTDIK